MGVVGAVVADRAVIIEASEISRPLDLLILGAGDLLDKINDGSSKLGVANLHERFGEPESVRRGEIVFMLGKARERHHAAAFDAEPAPPMRGADVAHIGDAGIGIPAFQRKERRRHAPPRHGQLAAVRLVANDRRLIIRKDSWEWWQVARPVVHRARKLSDGVLTLRYRVEVAQFDSSLMTVWSPLGHKVWSMSFARRPLLYLPIALLQVLDDGASNLVLLLLGQRSSHAADESEPFAQAHDDAQAQVLCLAPHRGRIGTERERGQVFELPLGSRIGKMGLVVY
jgi:hypothetical protein